jgi:hypothetical protein
MLSIGFAHRGAVICKTGRPGTSEAELATGRERVDEARYVGYLKLPKSHSGVDIHDRDKKQAPWTHT